MAFANVGLDLPRRADRRRSRVPVRQGPGARHRLRGLRSAEREVLRGRSACEWALAAHGRAGGDGARPRPRLARVGPGAAQSAGRRGRAAPTGTVVGEGGTPSSATGMRSPWRWPRPASGPAARRWSSRSSPATHRGKQPPCTDAIIARRSPPGRGRDGRSQPGGGRRRRTAAAAGRRGRGRRRAGKRRRRRTPSSCIALRRPVAALRRAQAGHDSRRPDRRCLRPLALDLREPARDYVHWLRAGFDAIGVGGRTARADDPSLTVRGPVDAARAAAPRHLRRGRRSRAAGSRWCAPRGDADHRRRGDRTPPQDRLERLVAAGVGVIRAALAGGGASDAPRRTASGRCWWRAGDGWQARCSAWVWWTATTGCRVRSGWGSAACPPPPGLPSDPIARAERWIVVGAAGAGRGHAARSGPRADVHRNRDRDRHGARSAGRRPADSSSRSSAPIPILPLARAWRLTGPVSRSQPSWPAASWPTWSAPRSTGPGFGDLTAGSRVNLERALRVGDRLGGHLVQGHVDGVGTVVRVAVETRMPGSSTSRLPPRSPRSRSPLAPSPWTG